MITFDQTISYKVFQYRGGISCTDFTNFQEAVKYAIRKTKDSHTNWVEILGVTEHSGFIGLWKWEDK